MRKWLTRKNLFFLILVCFLLSMIPVLIMARYALPYYDDYDYGYLTHQAWLQTGSFFSVLKAAAEQAAISYNSWQGTFTGIFFMALSPGIYDEFLYPLGIYALIILFCASILIFFKVVLRDYIKMERYAAGIVSVGMLFLIFQFMISRSEGLFWYNGGFYYTGFYAFALLMFSALLTACRTEKRRLEVFLGVCAVILALLVGGSNYVCALTTSFALGLFAAYRGLIVKKKWLFPVMALAVLLAALLLNGMAPGNQVRQERFESPGAVKAIAYSLAYGLQFLTQHIHLPILLGFLLLLPLLYQAAVIAPYSYRYPGFVSIVSYCVFASSFTPSFYALNKIGPPRTLNISFFTCMILLFLNIFYWCGWLGKKGNLKAKFAVEQKGVYAKQALAAALVLCILGGTLGLAIENRNSVTSIGTLRSLYNGEVITFYEENVAIINALKDPDETDVVVRPYSVKPYFFYQNNLSDDPDSLLNQCTAKYYGKDSVICRAES